MLLEATTVGLAATMTLTNPMPFDTQMTDSMLNVQQHMHEIILNLDNNMSFSNTFAPYEEYLLEKKILESMDTKETFVIKRYVKRIISAEFEVTNIKRKSNILHFD